MILTLVIDKGGDKPDRYATPIYVPIDAPVQVHLVAEGKTLFEAPLADLLGREDVCFRCEAPITSQAEITWLDTAQRGDCSEGEIGSLHEPEPD